MACTIERVNLFQIDLEPQTVRTDAIQSFVRQETVFVELVDSEGKQGLGYTYTIGTGGSSILHLLKEHLGPQLIGKDPSMIEATWKSLYFHTHSTTVGAITSLALAAIDTALWDLRCKSAGLPLHLMAGGAQQQLPLYTTEGGWLHLPVDELVEQAVQAQEDGFLGCKIKIGKKHASEDVMRLREVRNAVGDKFEIMVDANQGFSVSEAIRRARLLEPLNLGWLEEPLPAWDVDGHRRLSEATSLPVAVGESLYHPAQFRDYLQRGACSIVQVDVARIGGITPWLKTAHLAETFNVDVCPHFLMELHIGLCAAVPNAKWVEYIPQLDDLTLKDLSPQDGYIKPSCSPGIGIDWDTGKLETLAHSRCEIQ